MISYTLWQSRFAGDPRAVGRTLSLDGAPFRIIGVLPKDFEMPTLVEADVVLPLALNEATERSGRALRVFARLKRGITVERAYAELQPEFQARSRRFRRSFGRKSLSACDRARSPNGRCPRPSPSLLAVLLIACADIASLLIARALARDRELAVRAALGASRWRLARQTLTESLIVGIVGATAGCAFAALAAAHIRLACARRAARIAKRRH